MIRLYEYSPRVDEETGTTTQVYRDFQNYLFSHPYGFLWDFAGDKVTISGVAYRISSLQRIPDHNQITCLCVCGNGNGNGEGGTGGGKIITDVSLHGEGNEALPLGVQISKKFGNRLQILDDGCYVGGEPIPYVPPAISLLSSVNQGDYMKGDVFQDMQLTVRIGKGSENIKDVRIYRNGSSEILHVFTDIVPGSKDYTFKLPVSVDGDITFRASCSDGAVLYSNTLSYKFWLPLFAGIAGSMTVTGTEITQVPGKQVTGSTFAHVYESFSGQYLWMACPANRVIKSITDENGFTITTAFIKSAVKIKVSETSYDYTLHVFDTKTTGKNYTVTFNF